MFLNIQTCINLLWIKILFFYCVLDVSEQYSCGCAQRTLQSWTSPMFRKVHQRRSSWTSSGVRLPTPSSLRYFAGKLILEWWSYIITRPGSRHMAALGKATSWQSAYPSYYTTIIPAIKMKSLIGSFYLVFFAFFGWSLKLMIKSKPYLHSTSFITPIILYFHLVNKNLKKPTVFHEFLKNNFFRCLFCKIDGP